MKLAVERAVGDAVPGVFGDLHRIDEWLEARHKLCLVAFDSGGDRRDFENFAKLADHCDLVRRDAEHIGATLGQHLDEPLRLQLQERFAHRRLGHAELGRERVLRQRFAQPQAAVDDTFAQFFDHQLGQRLRAGDLGGARAVGRRGARSDTRGAAPSKLTHDSYLIS